MPITGNWRAATRVQAGAHKWGTGVNPVHGVTSNEGPDWAPTPIDTVDDSIVSYGYTDEDNYANGGVFGSELDNGMRMYGGEGDRQTASYPSWDDNGNGIRAVNNGASLTRTQRNPLREAAMGAWRNKETDAVNNAVVSDDRQYTVATSMQQRDQVRTASPMSSRASEYAAPIPSRIPGMKVKGFTDPDRLEAMEPKSQDTVIRPWWARNAGTGPVDYLSTNDMYASKPMTRNPPPDADQGGTIVGDDAYIDEGSWY